MNNPQYIKAIAFDLDGTLVDSVPGLTDALNAALQAQNLSTVTTQQVKQWIGNGADIMIQRALNAIHASTTLQSTIRKDFDDYYQQTVKNGTVLYPNVVKTLIRLQQKKYPMAIVTNKPRQFIPDLLQSLNIQDFFSLVLGGDDVTQQKPHPAPLYLVLAHFGLHSTQLLFVGDSKNDVIAAKQAHCQVAGLSYGYNYGEPIASSNPDYTFEQFEQILTIIE